MSNTRSTGAAPPCTSQERLATSLFHPGNGRLFQLLTDCILPYYPTTSSANLRAQRDAASQLSRSPPLALVALSPAMRIHCEDEQPYRLGGAWWLSNYVCEEIVAARDVAPVDVTRHTSTDRDPVEAWSDITVYPGLQRPSASAPTPRESVSASGVNATTPLMTPTAALSSAVVDADMGGGSGSNVMGRYRSSTSSGLRARDGQTVMTRGSGHMALLPRQLSSTRLFSYLEGIPTTWISFCATAAQSCCSDALEVHGAPDSLVEALRRPVDAAAMGASPRVATMTSVVAQLYVMCNHPEARLAYSLWWCRRRLRVAQTHSRRRAATLRLFEAQRQARYAQDGERRRQQGLPPEEAFLFDVSDTQALFLCADLTYLSTVDKIDATARAEQHMRNKEALMTFVFLNGAVTLAVQKELHRERVDEITTTEIQKRAASAPSALPDENGGGGIHSEPFALPPVTAAVAMDDAGRQTPTHKPNMASREVEAEGSHVDLVPLLGEFDNDELSSSSRSSSDDDDDGDDHRLAKEGKEAQNKHGRATGSHPFAFLRHRHRHASRHRTHDRSPYQRLLTLIGSKLFRTAHALTSVHVHMEVSRGLLRESASALGRLHEVGCPTQGTEQTCSLCMWDASWLSQLFPDVRLLDLDGEGSGSIVSGSYIGGGGGKPGGAVGPAHTAAGSAAAAMAVRRGGRVTFQATADSPSSSPQTSPILTAAEQRGEVVFTPPTALLSIDGLHKLHRLTRLFIRRCHIQKLPATLFLQPSTAAKGLNGHRAGSRVLLSHTTSTASLPGMGTAESYDDMVAIETRGGGSGSGDITTSVRGLRELCVAVCTGMSPDMLLMPTPPTPEEGTQGTGNGKPAEEDLNAALTCQASTGNTLRSSLRVLSLTDMPLEAAGALHRMGTALAPFIAGVHSPATTVAALLTHLDLSRTPTTSEGLAAADLPRAAPLLTVLRLSATEVQDVSCLVALPHLRILNVAGSQVNKRGLALVPFFPKLEELYLMNCPNLVMAPRTTTTTTTPTTLDEQLQPQGGNAVPVLNIFSLNEWDVTKKRLEAALPTVGEARIVTGVPDAAVLSASKNDNGSTASHIFACRRTFPSLRVLDVSTNRMLTEYTLFPFISYPTWPNPQGARACPPGGFFPCLERLQVMLTSVAQLGPLSLFCPKLTLLDASYTNVTAHGLWTTCELPTCVRLPCAAHVPEKSKDVDGAWIDEPLPPPLRLKELRLSGTAVRSLAPLRMRPPAPSLGALARRCIPALLGGARDSPDSSTGARRTEATTSDVATERLLRCADFANGPFFYTEQARGTGTGAGHSDEYYYCHSLQFLQQPPNGHRSSTTAYLRYGFTDALALRELTCSESPLTGRGLGAAFVTARADVAAGKRTLSATVAEGHLSALYLRGNMHLLHSAANAAATPAVFGRGPRATTANEEEEDSDLEAGDHNAEDVARAGRIAAAVAAGEPPRPPPHPSWSRARPAASDGALVSLATAGGLLSDGSSHADVKGLPSTRTAATASVSETVAHLDPDTKGLLVALDANATSLRVLDVAATDVSLDVFLRPAEPRARLVDVFVPLFISQEELHGWEDDEGSDEQEEEVRPGQPPVTADAEKDIEEMNEDGIPLHANEEEDEEEEVFFDGLLRNHSYRYYFPDDVAEDESAEEEEEDLLDDDKSSKDSTFLSSSSAAVTNAAARLRVLRRTQRDLQRAVLRNLRDRRVGFWLRFLCQPQSLVTAQVPLLQLEQLHVGGTAVGSFLEELVTQVRVQSSGPIPSALRTAAALRELALLQEEAPRLLRCLASGSTAGDRMLSSSVHSLLETFPLSAEVGEVVQRCQSVPAVVARVVAALWGPQCLVD